MECVACGHARPVAVHAPSTQACAPSRVDVDEQVDMVAMLSITEFQACCRARQRHLINSLLHKLCDLQDTAGQSNMYPTVTKPYAAGSDSDTAANGAANAGYAAGAAVVGVGLLAVGLLALGAGANWNGFACWNMFTGRNGML